MQAVTIHKAGAQDAAAIATMAHELAAFEGEASLASAASIAQALAEDGPVACQCYLAKQAGEAAGFILFYAGYDLASASVGYHLADLYVKTELRAQGIGQKLLEAMAMQAQEQGMQWISLTALQTNVQAKAFHDKMGFILTPVDFFAIGRKGIAKLATN